MNPEKYNSIGRSSAKEIFFDEKPESLNTPQINKFSSNSHVFDTYQKDFDSQPVEPEFIPFPTPPTSSNSSPTSFSSPSASLPYFMNSAPKKSILQRTFSRNDSNDTTKVESPKTEATSLTFNSIISNLSNSSIEIIEPKPSPTLTPITELNFPTKFENQSPFELNLKRQISEKSLNTYSTDERMTKIPKSDPLMMTNETNKKPALSAKFNMEKKPSIEILIDSSNENTNNTNNSDKFVSSSPEPCLLNSPSSIQNRNLNALIRCSSLSNDDDVSSSGQSTAPRSKRSILLNTEQRKEQIRNSNREAARRCRERRRNYIETLELNIRKLESKNKALEEENLRLVKEKSEMKSFNFNAANKCFNQFNFENNPANNGSSTNNNNNHILNQSNHTYITAGPQSIKGFPLIVFNMPQVNCEQTSLDRIDASQTSNHRESPKSNKPQLS